MTEPTGPTAPTEAARPWRAIAAVGGVIVVVAVVIAALVLRDDDGTATGSPSSTASPTASGTSSDTASPSATPGVATPSATADAPAVIPENWTQAAVFSEPGQRYVLGDLVAWSDGLVAVGTLYEEEGRGVFGPPPPRAGRVWHSTDGADWTDATPVAAFVDVELSHLFVTGDGALVVIGNVYPEVDPVSAAWETRDGETWAPIQLAGLPEGAFVLQVASGAQGHVAATYLDAESHPLYSADGRTWQPAFTDARAVMMVAAGDDGFVASTFPDGATSPQVVASSDGLEWIDATEPAEGGFLAAPRGGDWLAATTDIADDGTVTAPTWGSANGLDWSALGMLPLGSVEFAGITCAEAPGALHGLPTMTVAGAVLASGCGEGAVVSAGASYASVDGVEWTELPFGQQAFAAGAVMIGDRVVIATDARTNQAPVIGVTFWISGPP